MDMEIFYRPAALVIGLLLALVLMNLLTYRQRKAAKARQAELSRTHADYWELPARVRRSRSKAA